MLKLEGEVDAHARSDWFYDWHVSIGEVDLVDALREAGLAREDVVVALQGEDVASGKLCAFTGFRGTDDTPPESPEVHVGGTDVFELLRDLDGERVTLCVERRAT